MALLGPNGAGKTTLQRLLRGSLAPQGGTVRVFGQDPCQAGALWRRRLAWLSDQPSLHGRLTCKETLQFYCGLYQVDSCQIETMLARVGLAGLEHRRAGQLSRGQQQRLAWARALLQKSDLLLLDEPTSGLDVSSKEEIHALIRDLRGSNCSVLLSTHDMREAQDLADRVAILERGQILDEGSPAELCQRHLGESYVEEQALPNLERVYRHLTGRSLYSAAERQN